METRKRVQETVAYVEASLTADVSLVGSTVSLSIKRPGVTDTWLPAGWVGTPTTSGVARTSSTVAFTLASYPPGDYLVRAKVVVGGETEIHDCYFLTVTP